jgi:hypothetical protein
MMSSVRYDAFCRISGVHHAPDRRLGFRGQTFAQETQFLANRLLDNKRYWLIWVTVTRDAGELRIWRIGVLYRCKKQQFRIAALCDVCSELSRSSRGFRMVHRYEDAFNRRHELSPRPKL